MTKEERLKWLEQIERDIYVCSLDSTFADDSKSCAIRSAIDELEQHRWIPVKERLPEEDGRYLCTYQNEDGVCIDFGMYEDGEWYVSGAIAWAELPKPYEEGAE